MKRLILALIVMWVASPPAAGALCGKCRDRMYTADVGTCVVCGGETSSGAFKLCKACSGKLGQCEHCRAALAESKARPAEGARIDLHKSGSYNVGRWRYEYTIGAAGSRSEGRHGELSFDDKPIPDVQQFDRINTPWGMMQFFGPKPRRWGNGGWLLKQCYDQPIDPKKGRLLPDPAERETANQHAATLKRGVKDFILLLQYFGEQGKPFYELKLSRQLSRLDRDPFRLCVAIDEKQAFGIIDHLAASGFLGRAEQIDPLVRGEWPGPRGPCYLLTVCGGAATFREDLGWGLPMLKRLDALRGVLEGDAAKQMDLLLGRLSGLRKAWTDAEKKAEK
ncbi:MAG TPA: hypothetical protein VMZ92_15485 [Planctomycetota bacterium]|nr:hypothetical protein [Planctomycetota bacterium]